MLLGEEEEDWEAIEKAHNRELLVRLVLQVAATCLTVWALPCPLACVCAGARAPRERVCTVPRRRWASSSRS